MKEIRQRLIEFIHSLKSTNSYPGFPLPTIPSLPSGSLVLLVSSSVSSLVRFFIVSPLIVMSFTGEYHYDRFLKW